MNTKHPKGYCAIPRLGVDADAAIIKAAYRGQRSCIQTATPRGMRLGTNGQRGKMGARQTAR